MAQETETLQALNDSEAGWLRCFADKMGLSWIAATKTPTDKGFLNCLD
jgi:hypothetical protein